MAEALLTFGSESRFEDPALEEQYDQERRALLEPAQGANRRVLLVLTLAAFILTQLKSSGSALNIAMIVAVLLFHELGHYAGMRVFGYRDVRMFFVPFLGAAVSGRRDGTALPTAPAQLDDRAGRTLFLAARQALPDRFRTRAKAVAAMMREVLDAARPAPGLIATCLLLVGWLFGVTAALAATSIVAWQSAPDKWQRYEIAAGGFAAEYPSAPAHFVRREKTPFGELDASYVTATQDMLHRYTVQYYDAPAQLMSDDISRWMDERLEQLSRQVDAPVVASSPEGDHTRIDRPQNGRRVWLVRPVARGNRFHTVTTSSPEPGQEADRFFASFALLH